MHASPLFLLLELLVKGFAPLACAHLAVSALHRASAAARHLVWLATFALLLALPLAALSPARWHLVAARSAPPPASTEMTVTIAAPAPTPAPALTASVTVPPAEVKPSVDRPMPWAELVIAAWALGAAALFAPAALAQIRLRRLRHVTPRCVDADILARTAAVARELGLRRPVNVLELPAGRVPLAWGWRHPVLALPRDAATWSTAWFNAVLRHELGHLVRRDPLWRALAQFACALHWPNPLAWFAARRWRLAQEQACDDLAISPARADAAAYAERLLNLARSAPPAPSGALAMSAPAALARRVRSLLDPYRSRRAPGRGARLAGGGAALLVFAACASVGLVASPQPAVTDRPLRATEPSAPPDATAHRVRAILVRFERAPVMTADEVRAIMGIKEGGMINDELVDADIRALHRTGRFDLIEISRTPPRDGLVDLIVTLTPPRSAAPAEPPGPTNTLTAVATATVVAGTPEAPAPVAEPAPPNPVGQDTPRAPGIQLSIMFLSIPNHLTPPADYEQLLGRPEVKVLESSTLWTTSGRSTSTSAGTEIDAFDDNGAPAKRIVGTHTDLLPVLEDGLVSLTLEARHETLLGYREENGRRVPFLATLQIKCHHTLVPGEPSWIWMGPASETPEQPEANKRIILLRLLATVPGADPGKTPPPRPAVIAPGGATPTDGAQASSPRR